MSSIDVNNLSLLTLFCHILSDSEERRNLNAEKLQETNGLIKYMQSFEFIFGIKLSKMLYCEAHKIATHLQGDKVSIFDAIQFVTNLVGTLKEKRGEFEVFWTEVKDKRVELNEEANNIPILQRSSFYTEMEESSCPRASIVDLRRTNATEEDAIKLYRKEHYVGVFDTILEYLEDMIDSLLIKIFVEIENIFLSSINSPQLPITINNIDEAYRSK